MTDSGRDRAQRLYEVSCVRDKCNTKALEPVGAKKLSGKLSLSKEGKLRFSRKWVRDLKPQP